MDVASHLANHLAVASRLREVQAHGAVRTTEAYHDGLLRFRDVVAELRTSLMRI